MYCKKTKRQRLYMNRLKMTDKANITTTQKSSSKLWSHALSENGFVNI